MASGRRSGISLGDILQFITGSSEEPTLGFAIQPSIQFRVAISTGKWYFVPTSNSCSQTLYLPIASFNIPLPDEDELFEVYDHAFKNAFFGLAYFFHYFNVTCRHLDYKTSFLFLKRVLLKGICMILVFTFEYFK